MEQANRYVDVQTLFRYAEQRVPQLARNIGGVQKPTNLVPPNGTTFVIGQMTGDLSRRIRLPTPKHFVLRPALGNLEEDNYDTLKLNEQLARLLNDENNPLLTRGREAALIYLNEDDFPHAIKPTGFYRSEKTPNGTIIHVKLSLRQDGNRVATIEFSEQQEAVLNRMLQTIRAELLKIPL